MKSLTDEAHKAARTQLSDAMTAYDYHALAAEAEIANADHCGFCRDNDPDAVQCECDDDEARTAHRTVAATYAQLANAAAVMAQAMATLLAADPS